MSPLFNDHFRGHMESGDPRSLVFAAAGCTWPTVPAWRYRAVSCNATLLFAGLNVPGLLLPVFELVTTHDVGAWLLLVQAPPILAMALIKQPDPANPFGSIWTVTIAIAGAMQQPIKVITRPEAKCNVPLLVGEMQTGDPADGTTGSTFRLEQVEWDEELAPDSTRLECT